VSQRTADHVRAIILEELAGELAALGIAPDAVGADFDLRSQGVIDSLGFLELVTALEERLGVEIDFEALPPEQLTHVGAIAQHVADQMPDASPVS
jgi:acyl carrier protein